ncbi:MAG: C25 family peptidase propeptide domain-containing protein, partial [Thermoplasmatota archaeon]
MRTKKRALLVVVIACLAAASFDVFGMDNGVGPSGAEAAGGGTTEVHIFSFGQPEITRGEWTRVSIKGCTTLLHEGEPMLPFATHTMTFPLGTKVKEVHVSLGDMEAWHLDATVAPAPKPVSLSMQHAEMVQEPGPVYSRSDVYPSEWVRWTTGAGLHNGEHVTFLTLQVFPVRYAPQVHELRFVDSIEVEVTYEKPSV